MKRVIIPVWVFLAFILPAGAVDPRSRRLSNNEIDAQLNQMREMLPAQIQSGIRWIDIQRRDKEVKYTYIVNIDTASLDDNQRADMIMRLQDFGCRQLLPAMCQGLEVMFASGLTASTVYHDSFGNFLFDCTFTPAVCTPPDEAVTVP